MLNKNYPTFHLFHDSRRTLLHTGWCNSKSHFQYGMRERLVAASLQLQNAFCLMAMTLKIKIKWTQATNWKHSLI